MRTSGGVELCSHNLCYYYYYYFPFMLDYDTDCCIPKNVQEFIVRMCEQMGLLFWLVRQVN